MEPSIWALMPHIPPIKMTRRKWNERLCETLSYKLILEGMAMAQAQRLTIVLFVPKHPFIAQCLITVP